MAADEQQEERAGSALRPARRPGPGGPRADTEKGLALEVARLFGVSPRMLLNRDASPQAPGPVESVTGEEHGEADADGG